VGLAGDSGVTLRQLRQMFTIAAPTIIMLMRVCIQNCRNVRGRVGAFQYFGKRG
jgi:hypothetical protein